MRYRKKNHDLYNKKKGLFFFVVEVLNESWNFICKDFGIVKERLKRIFDLNIPFFFIFYVKRNKLILISFFYVIFLCKIFCFYILNELNLLCNRPKKLLFDIIID